MADFLPELIVGIAVTVIGAGFAQYLAERRGKAKQQGPIHRLHAAFLSELGAHIAHAARYMDALIPAYLLRNVSESHIQDVVRDRPTPRFPTTEFEYLRQRLDDSPLRDHVMNYWRVVDNFNRSDPTASATAAIEHVRRCSLVLLRAVALTDEILAEKGIGDYFSEAQRAWLTEYAESRQRFESLAVLVRTSYERLEELEASSNPSDWKPAELVNDGQQWWKTYLNQARGLRRL